MSLEARSTIRVLVAALVMYVVTTGLLTPLFFYRLFPDTVSYFSVAQQYADGHWEAAVNGYWSPLFSWLLVPFIWGDVSPLLASKILLLFSGIVVICTFHVLLRHLEIDERLYRWAMLSIVPIVVFCGLSLATPDFLLVGLLLPYLTILLRPDFPEARRYGLFCGVLGGFAYLCKHYAIAFFAVHYTTTLVVIWLVRRREGLGRRLLLQYFLGMTTFAVICAAWIAVMSDKYGQITISQAGRYNHQLMGPLANRTHRLRSPTNSFARSDWDNPSLRHPPSWNPATSGRDLGRKGWQVIQTLGRISLTLMSFTLFAPVIVLAGITCCLRSKDSLQGHQAGFLVGSTLLYVFGYALISKYNPRHLWICWPLLLALAALLLYRWRAAPLLNGRRRTVALLLISASFVAPALYFTSVQANEEREVYEISRQLKSLGPFTGRLATLDRWRESLFLAYYLDMPFYGQPNKDASPEKIQDELHAHQIDYVLTWHDYKSAPKATDAEFLPPGRDVTVGKVKFVRLYELPSKWRSDTTTQADDESTQLKRNENQNPE